MLLSFALLLAAADTSGPFGTPIINGDWIAGCDNRRDCRLYTLPAGEDGSWEEEENGLEIAIERSYAVSQPVRVEIFLSSAPADAGKPMILRIDGKPTAFRMIWSNNRGNLNPRDSLRFVRALRSARMLEVVQGKKIVGSASIAGLLPLLDHVDKEQYRLGTVGALGVPGKKTVDHLSVPPLIRQPAIKMPPQSAAAPKELSATRLAEILKTDECLQYRDPKNDAQPEIEYARLDKDHTLALIGSYCGGYNPASRPYIINNEGRASLAKFEPNPMVDPDEPEPYLPGAMWDDKEHRLLAFGRARGIGDCGQQALFVWNGTKFQTSEYSAMPECRGSFNYVITYKRDVSR